MNIWEGIILSGKIGESILQFSFLRNILYKIGIIYSLNI